MHVFKAGDIIGRAKDIINEFLQGAGSLCKVDQEIMLQTFILKASFLDLLHPVDIIIAAAYYTNYFFAF